MPGDERFGETYSPWTIVNLVFHHLADQGLHPTLGDAGHPGEPAAELLRALGIEPVAGVDQQTRQEISAELAELRARMFDEK